MFVGPTVFKGRLELLRVKPPILSVIKILRALKYFIKYQIHLNLYYLTEFLASVHVIRVHYNTVVSAITILRKSYCADKYHRRKTSYLVQAVLLINKFILTWLSNYLPKVQHIARTSLGLYQPSLMQSLPSTKAAMQWLQIQSPKPASSSPTSKQLVWQNYVHTLHTQYYSPYYDMG